MKRMLTFLLLAPLVFALRLERVWDQVDTSTKFGHKEIHDTGFETEYLGSVVAKYPIERGFTLVGRAGYRFQADNPTYAIGVEYQFSAGR